MRCSSSRPRRQRRADAVQAIAWTLTALGLFSWHYFRWRPKIGRWWSARRHRYQEYRCLEFGHFLVATGSDNNVSARVACRDRSSVHVARHRTSVDGSAISRGVGSRPSSAANAAAIMSDTPPSSANPQRRPDTQPRPYQDHGAGRPHPTRRPRKD